MPKFEVLGNLSAGPGMRFTKGQVAELKAETAAPFVAKGLLKPVDGQVATEVPTSMPPGSGELLAEMPPADAEEKRGKGTGKK
jgi:hypothetical protein